MCLAGSCSLANAAEAKLPTLDRNIQCHYLADSAKAWVNRVEQRKAEDDIADELDKLYSAVVRAEDVEYVVDFGYEFGRYFQREAFALAPRERYAFFNEKCETLYGNKPAPSFSR